MEFLSSPEGLFMSVYILIGCLLMQIIDQRGASTSLISWGIGVVLWLPAWLIGFIRGITR